MFSRGPSQLTFVLGGQHVFLGPQLMKIKRKPLALGLDRLTGLGIMCRPEAPCPDPLGQLSDQCRPQTPNDNPTFLVL